MTKTRIFVDFWNFQLDVIFKKGDKYRIDWTKLSPWLMNEAQKIVGNKLNFEGMQVYMSFDPRKPADKNLRNWASNYLDRKVPGVNVIMKRRKPKNPPVCPTCQITIDPCPKCGNSIIRSLEKGIDTAIVTDLLSLAWEGAWDVAILLSSDRDFIPAVELLHKKGFKVLNGHFPPTGAHLAKTCWASIDLNKALANIKK